MTQDSPDVSALARAIRFSLVFILFGLCYVNFRMTSNIETFRTIYLDMLGGKPLPALTTLIFPFRSAWICISVIVPLCVLGTLFIRNAIHSFYALGGLALVTFLEMAILFEGLFSPLMMTLKALGGNPN